MRSGAQSSNLLRGVLALVVTLGLTLAAFGQQPKHALTNEDITKMVKGGFTDEVMVALIESSDTDFDVSLDGLTALKAAGVSGKVMEAMLKAEARKRQAPAPPAPAAAPVAQPTEPAPPSAPPPTVVQNPAMGPAGANNYIQQMMSMAMGGGMVGTLDMSQLPPVSLLNGTERQPVRPSVAQVANTSSKGDGTPGTGSAALGMLEGLGMQSLSFAAVGAGGMMAGPAAGMAMGVVGGMGRHHGPPKVTSVWALPGAQAGFTLPSNVPHFEMQHGNLLGIDPDAYEPMIVKLVNSKDNWRLVGATKTVMGQMDNEAYEKVTEVRVPVKVKHLGRGQAQFEPSQALEPGEYGVVLRAIHPGKRSRGSVGGPAERTVFFSVWDFSVGSENAASKH
jgi:hypothetical protein